MDSNDDAGNGALVSLDGRCTDVSVAAKKSCEHQVEKLRAWWALGLDMADLQKDDVARSCKMSINNRWLRV